MAKISDIANSKIEDFLKKQYYCSAKILAKNILNSNPR